MKYIKLFENFDTKSIDDICKKYRITNYTINDDGSIDVDGDVNLGTWDLKKLPLIFNKVNGDFDCYENELESLEGAPRYVSGYFNCGGNELTSLEYSPKYVGKEFFCHLNELTSLEHSPDFVGGGFSCEDNDIKTLIGIKDFNGLFEGNGIIQAVYDLIKQPELIEQFYNFGIVSNFKNEKPDFNMKRFEKFKKIHDLDPSKEDIEYVYEYYNVI